MNNKKMNIFKAVAIATTAFSMVAAMPVVGFAAPVDGQVNLQEMEKKEMKLSEQDVFILSQLFDAQFFAQKYPDVANQLNGNEEDLFTYFCKFGIYEGKQPCAQFDVAAYAVSNSDLAAAYATDVISYYRHYFRYGRTEDRVCTVEKMKEKGINTLLVEKQRFMIDENGQAKFVKFFDAEKNSFVYNALEANKVEPGTFSDYPVTVVSKSHKHGGSSLGFNQAAYERDYKEWMSKEPKAEDYMIGGSFEEYSQKLKIWQAKEPVMANVSFGHVYASEEQANEALRKELVEWNASKPNPEDFMEEDGMAQYTSAVEAWKQEEPKEEDYRKNEFNSLEDANNAKDVAAAALTEANRIFYDTYGVEWCEGVDIRLEEDGEVSVEGHKTGKMGPAEKENCENCYNECLHRWLFFNDREESGYYKYYPKTAGLTTEEACQEQYSSDLTDWGAREPKIEDYVNPETYKLAYQTWLAAEPKADDGYHEVDPDAMPLNNAREEITVIRSLDPVEPIEIFVDDRQEPETTKEEALELVHEQWELLEPVGDFLPDGQRQYEENEKDWETHEPEKTEYENGSDGNWEGCPDYEYVEPVS